MLPFILILSFFSYCCAGFPQNITIDDEFGDTTTGNMPYYSPSGAWSQGSLCSSCLIELDPARTYSRTWQEATWNGKGEPYTIAINLTGVAVYVFFILANQVAHSTGYTNVTFILDNDFADVQSFAHEPTISSDFNYSFPIYVNEELENKQHYMLIATSGQTKSVVLFDSLVYTKDASLLQSSNGIEPSSTAPHKKTVIVGSVIGGIVFVILVLAGFRYFCHGKIKLLNITHPQVNSMGVLTEVRIRRDSPSSPREHPTTQDGTSDIARSYPPYQNGIAHENSNGDMPTTSRERRDLVHEQGLTDRIAELEVELNWLYDYISEQEARNALPQYHDVRNMA